MRFGIWSTKGGAGCTSTSLGIARHLVDRTDTDGVLVIDLAGDCAAAAGIAESPQGITDWLNDENSPLEALGRLECDTSDRNLTLLQTGGATKWPSARNELLSQLLSLESRDVVIDCGQITKVDTSPINELKRVLVTASDRSLLCTRACYLSLRNCASFPIEPTGVVVLREPGRAYSDFDIEDSIGAPVTASVDSSASVSRSVDAGRILDRPPRAFLRQLRGAVQ